MPFFIIGTMERWEELKGMQQTCNNDLQLDLNCRHCGYMACFFVTCRLQGCSVMKHFYPDGSGLFQDDSGPVHRAPGVTGYWLIWFISLYISFVFQFEGESANMFYTCGPNEAMVVSGNIMMTCIFPIFMHYIFLMWLIPNYFKTCAVDDNISIMSQLSMLFISLFFGWLAHLRMKHVTKVGLQ